MLNIFPTEFLVAIFEDLDYDDLKLSIPLVCKRFRNILHIALEPKRSHIRQNLFVDEPNLNFPTLDTLYLHLENLEMDEFMPTNTLPTSDFQPHPMFKSMMIDHSRFQNGRPDTHLDLILMNNRPIEVESRDYKLLLENAITNAVGPRFIHIEQHSSIGVLSAVRRTEITPCLRKAVRVIDILTAISTDGTREVKLYRLYT